MRILLFSYSPRSAPRHRGAGEEHLREAEARALAAREARGRRVLHRRGQAQLLHNLNGNYWPMRGGRVKPDYNYPMASCSDIFRIFSCFPLFRTYFFNFIFQFQITRLITRISEHITRISPLIR